MRRHVRATIVVAVLVIVVAEVGLRAVEGRLEAPQYWYAPDAQLAVDAMERLEVADTRVDLVLAGSSMVQWGLIPDILEEHLDSVDDARNTGIPKGYTTVTNRWLPEQVLPRLAPERVVLGISTIDFNGGRPIPALPQYEAARAGKRGVFGALDRLLWSVSAMSRQRDSLRDPAFLLDLVDGAEPSPEPVALADLLAPIEWPVLAQTDVALQALTNSLLADYHIGDDHASAFEDTIRDLQARGIEVAIVILPVSQPYVDAHPEGERTYDQFIGWVSAEAERLGVPLFDHGRDIPEDRFLDFNHIDEAGARVLTELVAADLAGLGW